MQQKAWRFGDIVRVDNSERRWMVVKFEEGRVEGGWTLMFIAADFKALSGVLTHWSSMSGFIRVDNDDLP